MVAAMKSMALLILLAGAAASAQVVVPSDIDYWTQDLGQVQYIYPADQSTHLPELIHYTEFFTDKYRKSYKWTLDEKLKLILASGRNQIANGFATPQPFLQSAHYPSGAELLDFFAQDSFMLALSSHETAHLFQLSAKSRMGSFIKSILGNTSYIQTPFIVPIFVFPNAFNPRFILEGNAVMNESVTGIGGRLWSGEIRAEVLAQIRAGEATPAEMINSDLDFPLSEDYHLGGYFAAHLAEEFGVDRANQFFVTHAERDMWAFALNKSFRQHFTKSYTRVIHEMNQSLRPLAEKHRPARGEVLAKVFTRPTFNHDNERVFFVANPDGKTANRLYEIRKSDGRLKAAKKALPLGKAFELEGEWYTVSSETVNPTNIKYGLFDDSLKAKRGTLGYLYQDIRFKHEFKIDAGRSYARNIGLKDGQFLDFTGSSAVLDDQGRAHYFRLAGNEKILYRDKDALFKFKGYYGFPTEVTADGAVYFIASSEFGATLFRWTPAGIERMFSADNVMNARLLKDDIFVVAAITDRGYEIQKLKAEPALQEPAFADWKLPNDSLPVAPETTDFKHDNSHEYEALSQLRYSFADLALIGAGGAATVVFADPMMWNLAILGYRQTESDEYEVMIGYTNHRHRLGWTLLATYERDKIEFDALPDQSDEEITGLLALDYPLFKSGRWSSTLLAGPTYTRDSRYNNTAAGPNRPGILTNLDFTYSRVDYPLAFDQYRYFRLNYQHRTETDEYIDYKTDAINAVDMTISGDVYWQTFLELYGSWGVAENDSIDADLLDLDVNRAINIPQFTGDGEVKDLREWSVQLKQAVDVSYYFPRFPLSLRRLAPFAKFRDIHTVEEGLDVLPHWSRQLQLGAEFEMLLLHILPVRFTTGFDTIDIAGEADLHYGWFFKLKL
jgi:hypothetical protein